MKLLEIEIFGRGGLTHYVFNLCRALAGRGVSVRLVTAAEYEFDGSQLQLPSTVQADRVFGRVTHRVGPSGPWRRLLRGVEFIPDSVAVLRLAMRWQPDIVHLHLAHPIVVWLMLLLRLGGQKMVLTAHDVTLHRDSRFLGPIYGLIYRLADHIVVHGEISRDQIRDDFGVDEDRISILPHGDYSFFLNGRSGPSRQEARADLNLAPHEDVVLVFGFICEHKGLDDLLAIWPDIVAARSGARLLIAGDPGGLSVERWGRLLRRAESVGAICFPRYIPLDEVATFFSAADLMVLPYRRISQSGALHLAQSLGVPVVATSVGALPEVVTHGETGILVPPGSAAELKSAILQLLDDPTLRSRLADAANDLMLEEHSWSSIAASSEALCTRIAAA